MKRLRLFIAPGMILVQALLLAWGTVCHSPVIDEPAHLAAGLANWELDGFELFKVNPPLVRMLAALPVLAAGAKTDYGSYSRGVGVRAEFAVMDDFVRVNGAHVFWLVTLARCALIPVVLLGGYICYRWARELYGGAAGLMALALWCFSPNVLAYGQVINADAAATALGVTAAYFFWKWLREPAWGRAVAAGLVLGLAELTKTTWVVLFGLWPLLWLVVRGPWEVVCRLGIAHRSATGRRSGRPHPGPLPEGEGASRPHPGPRCPLAGAEGEGEAGRKRHGFRREAAQLAMMLMLGVFCVNAGYDFEGSGTRLRDYLFVSRPLTGAAQGQRGAHVGNRFAKNWLGMLPVPLPKCYVEGIDLQWHDIEIGKPSYLRGQWQERGWWYWYFYALAVKVPLGIWGMFLLTVLMRVVDLLSASRCGVERCVDHVRRCPFAMGESTWRDELVLLAPAAAVLVLVSSQTGFSRYIRYALPALPFAFVWVSSLARFIDLRRLPAVGRRRCEWAARVLNDFGSAKKKDADEATCSMLLGVAATALLAWSAASSLSCTPHWMSYFNELAGGPLGGPAHLLDAQVDWGQDILYLGKWLKAHPESRPFHLAYFGSVNPQWLGIDFALPPKAYDVGDDRSVIAPVPADLQPGWYAVSVNFLYGYPDNVTNARGSWEYLGRAYYSYFRRFKPVATAGYSIYIYHLSADDLRNTRHCDGATKRFSTGDRG